MALILKAFNCAMIINYPSLCSEKNVSIAFSVGTGCHGPGSKCREVVLAAGSSFVEQATEAKVI